MTGLAMHMPTLHGSAAEEHERQRLTNSVPVPDRDAQREWPEPPRVSVRLDWLVDGEQWRNTIATRWAYVGGEMVVHVQIIDSRLSPSVWLRRGDIVPW